jgi:hypothetical protein
MKKQPHLFLDCDGVLADFDRGAKAILGASPAEFQKRYGPREFWKRLARARNFYGELEEIPDARRLFHAVKHLDPTILTGMPFGKWAAPQKQEWAARHFPGVPIITTVARQKHQHMDPGDVLVDDRENHRDLWEEAGGIFIHHKNAEDTLRQLAEIYPSVKADA